MRLDFQLGKKTMRVILDLNQFEIARSKTGTIEQLNWKYSWVEARD